LISLAILATSQAKFHLDLDWGRLATAMLIILSVGVFLVPPWHGTALFSLLMKLPIGIAVVFIVALLMAPDWCIKGVEYLRRWAVT
jgi:hypothetical protein